MATKITTAVFALIMGFAINSFAGTPETKGEAKPAENQSKSANTPIACYRDNAGVYHEKLPGGQCVPKEDAYCTYTYNGDSTPEFDQDPAHYTPDLGTEGDTWQP